MPIPVAAVPSTQNQVYPPAVFGELQRALASLNVQTGAATLVAGTVTISGVTLTANSVILCRPKTAGGTAGAGGPVAPSASRNTGAGTFVINSVDLAGTLVATDTSTVDWMIVG